MTKLNCILLVDDSAADNEFHKIAITRANVCDHIEIATGALQALEYLNKCKEIPDHYPVPDLIFLDVNMPVINGFEFLKEYHNISWKFPDTQVIMLTTSMSTEDKISSIKAFDISSFVNKPLTVESITRIVEKYFKEI